jgi:uncharacterized Ntn-hydrolase superfamily protein
LLKKEEAALGAFAAAFGGGKTVDTPASTIAKIISDKHPDQLRHVDIRVDPKELPLVEQRDEAMVAKIVENLRNAKSILVIVGEDHRAGMAQRLTNHGFVVDSLRFP